MRRRWIIRFMLLLAMSGCYRLACLAAEEAEGLQFFESTIRPILVEQCYACHSTEQKQKGGLLLDSRPSLLKGGDSGAAIIPDDAKKSLLIQAVRHEGDFAMPPEKKLTPEQIAALEKWVDHGAPDSRTEPIVSSKFARAKNHWAFQPLQTPPSPSVKHAVWPKNQVDHFILARLEAAGLEPAPEADRSTLIRRLSLDLLGLPPTPEVVAAFVADDSPLAYEQLVDRLLASPHYGERWGRHWLDLARYADSSGFHNDLDRPHAWKYRDYVVRSFNEDKPYARFVAEQLAGDEVDEANEETLIATGFCRNGPSNDDNMGKTQAALKQYRADQLDDVISTVGTVFLGVTIGCARCHDHKTDPFPTRDYYSLLAIFNGAEKRGLVPGTEDMNGKQVKVDPAVQLQAFAESKSRPPRTFIMRRGNAMNLGEEVFPAVPGILGKQPDFPEPAEEAHSSLRRRTLAEWITSPENALAWRVLANRVWQHHFGKGLVSTPSNFGFTGASPTHPELLDFLAAQLIAEEGRLKPLHRLLLTSATYRQVSTASPATLTADPANELLGRMNLHRLEAEAIRDSILTASGKLNPRFGGPGIKPRLRPELIPNSQRNKWPAVAAERSEHWRRSVYIYSKRQLLMPMMELFDAPSTTDSCAVRPVSVVPTQALVLMNDDFVEEQAGFLAERVLCEVGEDPAAAVERLFLNTWCHPPNSQQREEAVRFIERQRSTNNLRGALADLAHVLFNSSEFIYVP